MTDIDTEDQAAVVRRLTAEIVLFTELQRASNQEIERLRALLAMALPYVDGPTEPGPSLRAAINEAVGDGKRACRSS